MANDLLQSSQNKQTIAPGYYTDYLSNLASKGQQAASQAQFAGAQPLQTQAFCKVASNFGAGQAGIQSGQNLVGQAAQQNVTGAAAPYLQAGTGSSPLNAMTPYAQSAMCTTGYEAGMPLVAQGSGLSGLTAASPFLGRAAGVCGACVSGRYVNQATQLNTAGAAQPYLQQAATSGGLGAANPYLQQATGTSPAELAAQYMNPYINTAVQGMSDIAQRNIRNNLSPAATAAAVGSGQFGSQRGAQVLGQIQSEAQQDLNSKIQQMLASGYGQALCAAGKQNALTAQAGQTAGSLAQQQAALLGQLGSTAGSLTAQQQQNLINAGNTQGTLTQQQANLLGQLGSTAGNLTNQTAQNLINAGTNLGNLQQGANTIASNLGSTAANAQAQQNQANLTAAQTASQAATSQGNLLNQAGQNMGQLAQAGSGMNLACINALSTLGGQQQTIEQNRQNFPLTNLSNLAGLLQGYSIPTSTKTTLCMSPLSGLAAIGSGALGMVTPGGSGKTPIENIGTALGKLKDFFPSNITTMPDGRVIDRVPEAGGPITYPPEAYPDNTPTEQEEEPSYDENPAAGGPITYPPEAYEEPLYDEYSEFMAKGGLVAPKARGYTGCASTSSRGALPYRKG